jgi:trimethylamine--corrinoid protein Co-methyltransferase
LGDRTSPKEWAEIGKPVLTEKATKIKEDILSKPSEVAFDPILDASLRKKYKIHLNMN